MLWINTLEIVINVFNLIYFFGTCISFKYTGFEAMIKAYDTD